MNLRALLALGALASPAMAFADDPACVDGAPGMLLITSNKLLPLQVFRSSASKFAAIATVTVVDSGSRRLKNQQVAFVLPPPPSTATFYDGSRKLSGTTGDYCSVQTPGIIGPAELGMMSMRVEVAANPNISRNLDFLVVAPPPGFMFSAVDLLDSVADIGVATAGSEFSHRVYAAITADDRSNEIGWSGVPLTFSLPETGPSASFPDGSTKAVVVTDAWGRAIAPPLRSNGVLGGIAVKVSGPTGASLSQTLLANVGPTRVEMTPQADYSMTFPGGVYFGGKVTFPGYPCAPYYYSNWGPVEPRFTVRANGIPFATGVDASERVHGCEDGNYTRSFVTQNVFLSFGRHEISVAYEGDGIFESSVGAKTFIAEVTPMAAGTTAAGGSSWQAGAFGDGFQFYQAPAAFCQFAIRAVAPGQSLTPAARPGFTFPFGAFAYELSQCQGGQAPGDQRIVIEFDSEIPRDARLLWYDPAGAQWSGLAASIEGRRVQFVATKGGAGDGGAGGPLAIRGIAAIALAEPGSAPGNYQDLWWGGPSQSGWGVGITQHDERVFVTLYAYDDSGAPRWWVVPGGAWSAGFRTFTGAIYSPSWPRSFANMVPGAPVGSMSLTFRDDGKATMSYEIDGRAGERTIERQPIAAPSAGLFWSAADMWWRGPEMNGVGTFVAQQGGALFVVNYGYAQDGKTSWSVIPSGGWWRSEQYAAPGWYETRGASFFNYEPSALKVFRQNAARIGFASRDKATLHLGCFVWSVDDWGCIDYDITRQPF